MRGDGIPGRSYADITVQFSPLFSPDSQHVAYKAVSGNSSFAVVDQRELTSYEFVGYRQFSPDSRRFAYVATRGSAYFYVIDDREEQSYDGLYPLVFSPDSKQLPM